MTIELYFSNRIERLAEKLADNLSSELYAKVDKFDPSVVIVPNRNMVKWLQLTLSRMQGILLQVRFDFMENGLWRFISELDRYRTVARLMDHKIRTLRLVQCLDTMDLGCDELSPVAGYLLDAKGERKIDYAPRLWQLSQRLSALFQEYEYHRADMIHRWQSDNSAASSMERCQQYLYCKVYGQGTAEGRASGAVFTSLTEYARNIIAQGVSSEKCPSRTIHILGMSQISGVHLELLGFLGGLHSIHIYTLNPSQEFWEDIRTPGERRWLTQKRIVTETDWETKDRPAADPPVQDHPLLSAWGKPGRENVRQLCDLTDYSFHDCFCRSENPSTLLHRLQTDLLTLASRNDRSVAQDTSLQIFACPSRFREVETVYNTICHNLRQDHRLKLTDMAILVPEMELYKPVFDAIFNRTPKIMRYNLVDSNAQSESHYGQAVFQILQLAQGGFTRKAVFELLLNPCLMQHWEIGVEEIRDWVNWADELNIFHGFSRNDFSWGETTGPERFSWKQALQRLRLGRIMSPEDAGAARNRDFNDIIPFTNLAASNQDVLEKFCLVVETLHSHVRMLSRFQGPPQEWSSLFASVCDGLIRVPPTHRGEDAVQYALFQGLEELNSIAANHLETAPDIWSVEHFQEYMMFILKGISGGRGDYLTGGVTISALGPMRPIPFKILFILGLEEGRFPGREVSSALDLRQKDHRLEDISLTERNCYLFLEMLLCARQKLYLGYVARDIQKDRDIQPCSVVNQLRHHLGTHLLAGGREFKIAQIPLKGNDPRYCDPERMTEWSDVMTNFSLADRISVLRSQNHWADFLAQASPEDKTRIQPLMPELNTSVKPDKGTDTRRLPVTARQLARFLSDPVKQSAQSHLGLYGPEAGIEDLALKEDEPFFSVFPMDYSIKMECLRLWLDLNFTPEPTVSSTERNPATILARLYADYEKQSAAPEGVFGDLDRHTILEKILKTTETLSDVIDDVRISSTRYRAIFFGAAEENRPVFSKTDPVASFPALEMAAECVGPHGGRQPLSAEIHAAFEWVWQDESGSWHTIVLTGAKKASLHPNRYLLRPLLAYLVCLSEKVPGIDLEAFPFYFHLVYETKTTCFKCHLTQPEAIDCLKNLLEAYGNQRDFHWLPFEKVIKCKCSPHRLSPADFTAAKRDGFADEMAVFFEEEEDYLIRRLSTPISSELFDIAHERFGWIFNVIEKE